MASASSWARVTPARRTRSSMPDHGAPSAIRAAVSLPMPRIEDSPRRMAGAPPGPRRPRPASCRPGRRLEPGVGPAGIHVGTTDGHPVALGVGHQAVGGPEPHGLRVQQPGGESRRIVHLAPGGGVDEMGEGHRVALGEPEIGERGQCLVHLLAHVVGDLPGRHPGEQPVAQAGHPLARALGAHRLAQLVGFGGGEPGHVDGDLHQLLLEQRDTERPLQRRLQQRVQIGDGLGPVAPADVGMDGMCPGSARDG